MLAELGRCTEVMSYLLGLYDRDAALFKTSTEKIGLIRQASKDNDFNLAFWDLEYARSKLANSSEFSFMEAHGTLYQSTVESGKNDVAMHYGRQFLKDPVALREHRIRKPSSRQTHGVPTS